LSDAKAQGCFGVVVKTVNSQDNGRLTTPTELQNLRDACTSCGLVLAIDETMTAIRCGAPFAHQRPEYQGIKPDLVFFGKALGAQGIAVNFDGAYFTARCLGLDSPQRRR